VEAYRIMRCCESYVTAFYFQKYFLLLVFVRIWVKSRATVRLEGWGKVKKFNDLMGTSTRDLPTCSTESANHQRRYVIHIKSVKPKERRGDPVSVLLLPLRLSQEVNENRTRGYAMRIRSLTPWAGMQPPLHPAYVNITHWSCYEWIQAELHAHSFT
jgi:hypothetical protein